MHLHADGRGATFTVDHRVNTWLTRGQTGHSHQIQHIASDRSRQLDGLPAARPPAVPRAHASARGDSQERARGDTSQAPARTEKDCSEKLDETAKMAKEEEEKMPEFMTPRMREEIGANVLRPEHTAKIKSHLARSETACDDTHQFNPRSISTRVGTTPAGLRCILAGVLVEIRAHPRRGRWLRVGPSSAARCDC